MKNALKIIKRADHLFILVLLLSLPLAGCDKDESGTTPDTGPVPCTFADDRCRARLDIGGDLMLPYYRSHPLEAGNESITMALILVHGANRNAEWNFETGINAMYARGDLENMIVIAPNFQTIDDEPERDEAYWSSNGWKKGHLSVADEYRTERISSFAAMDRIIEILKDRTLYINMEVIVVAGHSAGGQYVHRYAAGSNADHDPGGIRFRYIVANPSTYLYLGPERATTGSLNNFQVPSTVDCSDYNNWHYGLSNLNTYMSRLSLMEIRNNLTGRDVIIFVGSADTGSSMLDVSCGAMLQGIHRYHRGLTLVNYMDQYFPEHNHTLEVLSGVGHSSRTMFTSYLGLSLIFEP